MREYHRGRSTGARARAFRTNLLMSGSFEVSLQQQGGRQLPHA